MEKSRGFSVYMAIRRIAIESVIFRASRKSRSMAGKGIIITTRTVTTPITVSISLTTTGLDFDRKTSSIILTVVSVVRCPLPVVYQKTVNTGRRLAGRRER